MESDQEAAPATGVKRGAYKLGMPVEECQAMIRKAMRNPTVRFMREHLEKSGCPIGDNFIQAVECKEPVAGGFVRGDGVVVCSNHVNFQDEVNRVIIHNLIHAYDDCRGANLDWTDCAHHACSEIRAGHLSGDCRFKLELLRGHMEFRGQGQECVRRRAMESLAVNPFCSEAASRDAIEAVWDICYKDTKPFDRAP